MDSGIPATNQRLSLAELVDEAGVTVRTVRYYIAEGLLPPPMGTGPSSYYTRDHLDRLQLIGRLKDGYLPLKEIKRRLSEVDAAAIGDLLSKPDAELLNPDFWPKEEIEGPANSEASRYLEDVSPQLAGPPVPSLAWREPPRQKLNAPRDAEALVSPERIEQHSLASRMLADDMSVASLKAISAFEPKAKRSRLAMRESGERSARDEAEVRATAWQRIQIGDGMELHVRDDLYKRLRADIDSLIRLARKLIS